MKLFPFGTYRQSSQFPRRPLSLSLPLPPSLSPLVKNTGPPLKSAIWVDTPLFLGSTNQIFPVHLQPISFPTAYPEGTVLSALIVLALVVLHIYGFILLSVFAFKIVNLLFNPSLHIEPIS